MYLNILFQIVSMTTTRYAQKAKLIERGDVLISQKKIFVFA